MTRRTAGIAAAFGAVYVIWGSTYLGIRLAIDTIPPLVMAGLRFLIAGSLLYVFAIRRGDHAGDRPSSRHWRNAFIVGALLLAIGNGGVTFGEQYVASGIAALLVATVPLWLAVFAHIAGVERVNRYGVAGIVMGFAGVGLLLHPTGAHSAQLPWMLVILCSPVAWALGSLFARRASMPARPLVATAMEMIAGGLLLCVGATVHGEWALVHPERISALSAAAFVGLVTLGSIVAFTCYVWLLHQVSPAAISTYAYVNPLVAVLLGAAFLGEAVRPETIGAGALIVVAVAGILASRPRSPGPLAPAETETAPVADPVRSEVGAAS